MATIFAWSGALKRRGELDGLPELVRFGQALEEACYDTLNDGDHDEGPGGSGGAGL